MTHRAYTFDREALMMVPASPTLLDRIYILVSKAVFPPKETQKQKRK